MSKQPDPHDLRMTAASTATWLARDAHEESPTSPYGIGEWVDWNNLGYEGEYEPTTGFYAFSQGAYAGALLAALTDLLKTRECYCIARGSYTCPEGSTTSAILYGCALADRACEDQAAAKSFIESFVAGYTDAGRYPVRATACEPKTSRQKNPSQPATASTAATPASRRKKADQTASWIARDIHERVVGSRPGIGEWAGWPSRGISSEHKVITGCYVYGDPERHGLLYEMGLDAPGVSRGGYRSASGPATYVELFISADHERVHANKEAAVAYVEGWLAREKQDDEGAEPAQDDDSGDARSAKVASEVDAPGGTTRSTQGPTLNAPKKGEDWSVN